MFAAVLSLLIMKIQVFMEMPKLSRGSNGKLLNFIFLVVAIPRLGKR